MSVSKLALSAMTALSLVAVPVAASANPASSLSVASAQRAGAPVADVSEGRGRRGGGLIIALLAAAAIIAGIIIAADNNDNPVSR